MNYHIILVEDDKDVGYMLSEYLKLKDFSVKWVSHPDEAIACIRMNPVHLAILDVTLPVMDGFELAKRIRAAKPAIPLIFLTARSLKVDVLKGFNQGADDYIVKPVDEEELVARIHAVLKRYERVSGKAADQIEFRGVSLNIARQELMMGNETVKLTGREVQLLELFFKSPGDLVLTEDILRSIWGENDFFNRRSMDVFISRLRKKLKPANIHIENIHGKGFILKPQE
ncbi:response regulator transcription factor [Fulvivirga sedimenti]|uniref:Response regulator transcription factor n=1 Tax=Fulvivirga sedimenti TaxID=2879465 RepID=A0A9X1HT79_9BACT|nr:response regulator transcription factor [Fulvivirga sedimenti]MCA6074812.1 response regulator transcription factor [Fulvivirga sedimenti]MCA6075989.1 response regulator transcription factor [Fulvivirga sedimenti]MCA6077117.1 response regulator transcription factor [Fulvivirga sedimenti]